MNKDEENIRFEVLSVFLQSLEKPVIALFPDLTIMDSNKHATGIMGPASGQIVGFPLGSFLTMDSMEKLRTEVEKTVADPDVSSSCRLKLKSGSNIELSGIRALYLEERLWCIFLVIEKSKAGSKIDSSGIWVELDSIEEKLSNVPSDYKIISNIEENLMDAVGSMTPNVDGMGTATVLLVDDEPAIRRICEQILESNGFQVIAVENGMEALSICRTSPSIVDIAIIDLMMPHMNGAETIEQIRSIRSDLPVLIITGAYNEKVTREALRYKHVSLLPKPFNQPELLDSVMKILAPEEE